MYNSIKEKNWNVRSYIFFKEVMTLEGRNGYLQLNEMSLSNPETEYLFPL